MPRLRRSFLAVSAVWLAAATGRAAAPAAANASGQSNWAYPQGVIVSSDGGKVYAPEKKNRDDDDPPPPAANAELAALTKTLEANLTQCLAKQRAASPALQKEGHRYMFNIDFVIGADGQVAVANLVKRSPEPTLPPCITQLKDALAAHKFQAPKEARPLDSHIEYEALIMNDREAQGRGFQYMAAERAWEAKVKANKAWFTCSRDSDCLVIMAQCEAHGLRKSAAAAFSQTNAEVTTPCPNKLDLSAFQAKCRQQVCTVRHKARVDEEADREQ